MCMDCGEPHYVTREPPATVVDALRMVLAITMTREETARLVGATLEAPSTLWPSSLYRIAAYATLRSPALWRNCARRLDARLVGPSLRTRDEGSVIEDFCRNRHLMTWRDVAVLLWTLVREDSPVLYAKNPILGEVEVLALNRLSDSAA